VAYQKVIADQGAKRINARWGHPAYPGISRAGREFDGELLREPLPNAGAQNLVCLTTDKRPADQTENARSLGTIITFGKVRILDLGDLTWDKEMELVCPANKLGHVDIFIVSHHGSLQSNSPALLAAISPRIALWIMVRTKEFTLVVGHHQEPLQSSRTSGSFIFRMKAAWRTIPSDPRSPPRGTGCGQLSETIGLARRQPGSLNSRTKAPNITPFAVRRPTAARESLRFDQARCICNDADRKKGRG